MLLLYSAALPFLVTYLAADYFNFGILYFGAWMCLDLLLLLLSSLHKVASFIGCSARATSRTPGALLFSGHSPYLQALPIRRLLFACSPYFPFPPPSPTTSNDLRVYVGVSFSGILAWESLSLVYAIRPCLKTVVWCRVSGILRTTLRRNEAKAPLLSTRHVAQASQSIALIHAFYFD